MVSLSLDGGSLAGSDRDSSMEDAGGRARRNGVRIRGETRPERENGVELCSA